MLPPIRTFERQWGPVRYFMAPMSGITDRVFRQLIREMGAEVVISELISAEGIVRQGQRTLDMLAFSEQERPVGLQLFGGEESSLVESCRVVESRGVDFVDLNLGCPVKKVVRHGGGAAWLRDPNRLGKLLSAMKAAISIPLTIKIRTGWDDGSINAKEVVHVAAESGVSWVAIHGRTRAQAYTGEADWEYIREVAAESPIPIIGNGDILTAEDARFQIEQGYAHGVMIGRGALKNPWVFQDLLGNSVEGRDFLGLVDRHFELALSHKESSRAFLSLRKFLGWYAAGLSGASQFRKRLFDTADPDDLRSVSQDYFASVDLRARTDDGSPFLMGGHG